MSVVHQQISISEDHWGAIKKAKLSFQNTKCSDVEKMSGFFCVVQLKS